MSAVTDFFGEVVDSVLRDILRKATGTSRRARRRKLTAAERLRRIEKLLKPAERDPDRTVDGRFRKKRRAAPARRQTSRKRTVRSRSKARRRAY